MSPHTRLTWFLFSETGPLVTQAGFRYPRMALNSSSSCLCLCFFFFFNSCSSLPFLLSPSLMPGTKPLYLLGSVLRFFSCNFHLDVSRCLRASRCYIQSQLEKQTKAHICVVFLLSLKSSISISPASKL